MTLTDLLDRAHFAASLPIHYALGSGAPFHAPTPAGEDGCCDCSGFVAWCFQFARYQPHFAWLVRLNGGWMNTDGIVEDCDHSTGLWAGVLGASVGDVYVYPSRGYLKRQTGPKVGHVGLIVRTPKSGPRVIHCSSGNDRQFGHAIKETDGTIFLRAAGVITARYAGLL